MRITLTFFFIVWLHVVMSQTVWNRSNNNLVLQKTANLYEGLAIGSPSILLENDTLKMLYAAGGTDTKGRISYAYSTDGGETWVKFNNATPVFFEGNTGAWDSHFLDTPDWIKDSTGYKLYYFGDNDNDPLNSAIGMAISNNGLTWNRVQSQPIISPGAVGEWDELYIESPTVVHDDSLYYMWFSGVDSNYTVRIGMATSTDGINWQKHTANPVIDKGNITDWDGYSVATPTVIKHNDMFYMWYCGVSYFDIIDNNTVDTIKIGLATSTDGFNWIKYSNNPVMSTYDSLYTTFENRGPWAPDVIYDSITNQFKMLYETAYGFGLAHSPNTLNNISKTASSHKKIIIYPNPVSDKVYILLPKSNNDILYIKNISGIIVEELPVTNNCMQIDISHLTQGTYIVSLKNAPFISKRFIKTK